MKQIYIIDRTQHNRPDWSARLGYLIIILFLLYLAWHLGRYYATSQTIEATLTPLLPSQYQEIEPTRTI